MAGRRRPADVRPDRPGALVVGGNYLGLGIVRSLGRHGIPICVIDDQHSIARFSRYSTHAVKVPDLREERSIVDAVCDAGARLGLDGWVLYPTEEETVAAFSRHGSELSERFLVPTPGWETISPAWDKRATYRLGAELGIPVPRTWYPANADELDEIDAPAPYVVKPAIKEHFFHATKKKAWRADTREQLRTLFERAARIVPAGEVMVQELIPGDGRQQYAYCGLYKGGAPLATMVVRRRRQHPPEFGRASTFVETIELPLLETLAERFLEAIDYYGIVEVEFKLDTRDGRYKLLDVNPRAWGYHSLGARAGVDFAYLLYADQIGEPVERCRASAGVRWIRMVTDAPTALVEIRQGRLRPRAYIRSVASSDMEAVFSRDDWLPGLAEIALLPYLAIKRGF